MPNVIRIKRRTSGGAGAPASLKAGELAYNNMDNTIYAGFGDDGSGNATSVKPIGGEGSFADLASTQTVGGAKTFTIVPKSSQDASGSTDLVRKSQFDSGLAGKAASSHTHAIADVTGLQTALDAKAPLASPALTGTPTAPTAANGTNTTQLATTAFVLGTRLDQLAQPTADVPFNSRRITGLGDPVSAQDAATKNYVDLAVQGLDAKQSVMAATTANITLSGAQTIDGISIVAGDRVLVKNQSSAAQNGIYVAAAGAWTRSVDMNVWAEVPSAFCFVEQGTTQADTSWVCSSDQGGTIDSTAVTWFQFGSAASYLAGSGLQLAGNTFSAMLDGSTLSVSGSGLRISASYGGQNTIVTVGTITTGVWNGTTIAVANGGTGATTLTGLVKGNGTSAMTAAVDGTDYLSPSATIDGGTF